MLTIHVVIQCSQLHGHTTMFLCGQTLALRGQLSQTATDAESGVPWFNDIVNVSKLSSLIWIGKKFGVFLFLLCQESLYVVSRLFDGFGFFSGQDGYSATGTHDGNFRRRPCKVQVGTQLLASHHDMGTSIALAKCNRNLGYGGLAISIEQLCAMQNDGIVLLTGSRQESRNINKAYDGNVESIAETHKACTLAACVRIKHTCIG